MWKDAFQKAFQEMVDLSRKEAEEAKKATAA